MTNIHRGPLGAIWTGGGRPGSIGNPVGGGPKRPGKPGKLGGLLGGRKGGGKVANAARFMAAAHAHAAGGQAGGAPAAMPQAHHGMPPQQYAQQRLAQLSNLLPHGLPQGVGGGGNPQQQWRGLSPMMGALIAAREGHADQYQTPQNIDPRILALVQHILGGGSGNFEPGGQYGQQASNIRYGSAFGDQTRPFGP